MNANDIIRSHFQKLGKKGGTSRAAKLTPEQRTAIALKAAKTRWKKKKPKP